MEIRLKKVEGVYKDSGQFIESIRQIANEKLVPLLEKYNAANTVLQAAISRRKDNTITCKIHLSVPGKKILVARGKGPVVDVAVEDSIKKIFREAKRHFARLEAQHQYKRKERRKRLHELKAKIAELPENTRIEAEKLLSEFADKIKSIITRELTYLRAIGDLSSEYPTVEDILDEAMAATISAWKPGYSKDEAWQELLRNAFKSIDHEVENSRHYGKSISVYEPIPPSPENQAEAMTEEEFYEFYQPDEVLTFSDVIPERIEEAEEATALSEAEEFAESEKASIEAYSWDVVKHLPREWRRSFILAKVESMSVKSIASVLGASEKDVHGWLQQSCEFVSARLINAGISREDAEEFISSPRKATEENEK